MATITREAASTFAAEHRLGANGDLFEELANAALEAMERVADEYRRRN